MRASHKLAGNQLNATWIDKTRRWVMSVQEKVLNLLWTMPFKSSRTGTTRSSA